MTPATTEKMIQRLIRSPRLPLVTQRFQSILEAEQQERQRFYDEISETHKAEFINGEIITGTIQSVVVSGFEIPVRAVFDPAEQFAVLQAIMR